MSVSPFSFQLHHVDRDCAARRSSFTTPHGVVELPAFMPVGTQGTIKGLAISLVRDTGSQMVLGNTYHLALRPGEDVVAELGGLHRFMGWSGPILTDSGGFQLFSLAASTKVTEQSAVFRSHIDGRKFELSPERSIEIQEALGSDVAMVLDHVIALPASDTAVRDACDRTIRWARRCLDARTRSDQAQFAIVQGGLSADLRVECAQQLAELKGFEGYAIGGLSVGEGEADMLRMIEATCPALPIEKPRYLMGVGTPKDLVESIRRGVDMFDCIIPSHNGRNALAYTDSGRLRMRNLRHRRDERPLEEGCPCPACRHSRGYIRHLFLANEMLGPILLTAHNITYYQRLVSQARAAIESDSYMDFYRKKIAGWESENSD
ncbi:MAG: tRNA guanosine(34) transglycosylase Tgt [Planctomycetaceae bacterium]|nr:tRNA guanosine(34) transglycosylase Tgt [Planctomycetales bacterium]MCB9874047.1 tRNA guanosine(34) transglycosylase Tgt [Planctomycetaceae bacterium]MCB9937699.1 tRNA guanosine(34) transglycosylase Tgt [Planctomycetaceae bacterium]